MCACLPFPSSSMPNDAVGCQSPTTPPDHSSKHSSPLSSHTVEKESVPACIGHPQHQQRTQEHLATPKEVNEKVALCHSSSSGRYLTLRYQHLTQVCALSRVSFPLSPVQRDSNLCSRCPPQALRSFFIVEHPCKNTERRQTSRNLNTRDSGQP